MRGFEADVVRDAQAWKPRLKTRDPGRLRLMAARFLFARYPVAEHLEQIWIDCGGLAADEIALRKRWYIAAAGGASLHKAGAGAWLSRSEVHAFLNPLGSIGFEQAFWQAVARSYTHDPNIALRIGRSRIGRSPREELGFWRDAARVFCAHPATSEEIDDLCDYLVDCRRRDPQFSLKGRTLVSLGRRMREWHRDLAAIARIEAVRRRAEAVRNDRALADASWPGTAIPDWSWNTSPKDRSKREDFAVVQLRTATDLVAETRVMHHCVASYAAKCIAGQASIWSLRRRAAGTVQRLLTIELDRRNRVVQVRGFANRAPFSPEQKILERWAQARGIELA